MEKLKASFQKPWMENKETNLNNNFPYRMKID
jgi:hypothetical protein